MPRLSPTFLLLAGTMLATLPAKADYALTILHINDFHSRIEPINKTDSTCTPKDEEAKACFGGIARLKTAIDAHRKDDANILLLDAGDQFQGSLFYTTYKGRDAAEFMNHIGFEAMAVGNHEFDDGPPTLADFANRIHFPLLTANIDLSGEPDLKAGILPFTVVEKGGEKLGIVGLSPRETPELSSPGKALVFEDPIPAARRAVAALEEQGIDKIVLLSHSGYETDKRIAAAVDGIDVIVGGHSHTLLSNSDKAAAGPYPTLVKNPSGREVPIVQAASYGKYLGEVHLVFDDAGNVTSAKGDPILLDASIAEDAEFKARVAELAKPLEEMRAKVVAKVAGPVDGNRDTCRLGECSMGVLVTDAMLDRVKDQGVSIAIMNGGGLRASIDEGDVTMGEVLTVLPFQNTLATFRLKGAEIVAALENGVSQVQDRAGRFPQVAGLQIDWSPQGVAGENRIRAVRVKSGDAWVPIDPAATYGVVSNNYMRTGGDGYKVFAEKAVDAYDYGPTLETVVIDYLAKQNGAYQPHVDGRIKTVD
ncbi:multifunctional 2',3'-cyclic-nucleotide 2'-phosphodiesterase/5'-nucleotidase/3'-nucleotidase [Aureimonas endophytica]|uniref:Multifunctional 2',3'-cyclic-nucleotide 2'-phosphodiesterase/5'-nucleotidase/3'-nucleotidase n=1 Tax=Aureimonas endophytica TaxID=2027858 RepID=A0A916ZQK8_9HYPH|nr:bifunctional metallophosphatase/5'-nucleotidase [Aureimonas endophytica]GGE07357.1 multifunctional 2',3'-cyclic-nucleotide 2'-phosphodiesterase/5'-nucleotidase/3'-nucleotidase [Aureimonas endophytica]